MTLFVIPVQKDSVVMTRVCFRAGVRVSDVRYRDKNFEWVLLIWLAYTSLYFTLDFRFPLLAMTVIVEDVLYQLDKVRGGGGKSSHLLKPSSFL